MKFKFLYTREQRVYFDIDAETVEKAEALADEYSKTFQLGSPDDESDDPGNVEVYQ